MKPKINEYQKDNSKAVSTYLIKSHKPNTLHLGECFFILNKGLNSGKPLHEPCANCFVMLFANKEDRDAYYWLSFGLWKSKFWHSFLVGSVIPFLRLQDFKPEFINKTKLMMQEFEMHQKNIKALKLLELKESQFHKNLALISDMRRAILFRYINK